MTAARRKKNDALRSDGAPPSGIYHTLRQIQISIRGLLPVAKSELLVSNLITNPRLEVQVLPLDRGKGGPWSAVESNRQSRGQTEGGEESGL